MPEDSTVQTPSSTADCVEIIRRAIDSSTTLRLRSSIPDDLILDGETQGVALTEMAAVVDYPARDMTITVQPGITLRELDEILAQEDQQLPIDAFDGSMSIGALVAADVAGSRQFGYGTLRDCHRHRSRGWARPNISRRRASCQERRWL